MATTSGRLLPPVELELLDELLDELDEEELLDELELDDELLDELELDEEELVEEELVEEELELLLEGLVFPPPQAPTKSTVNSGTLHRITKEED